MRERLAAHGALRDGTAADHERLDGLFAAFDLGDRESYAAFLVAHAVALLPVERALDNANFETLLPDWPERRRAALIEADLAALGQRMPGSGQPPRLETSAAAWGAAYVLEGSRLGGALLAGQVADGLPTSYLGTPLAGGAWRKLLERLDADLESADARADAVRAARAIFALFEEAGRAQLERCRST